ELLSRRQQGERFANTLFPGLRPLRHVNPDDKVTTFPWWQLAEELPRFGVGLYRFRDVTRQLGNDRSRAVCVVGRCGREACRRERACCLQLRPTFSIEIRP